MKKILLTLAACVLAASFYTETAEAAKLSVEQVKLSPPDADAYIYSEKNDLSDVKTSDISADLGGKALDVEAIESSGHSNGGTFYAFLLDVSGSIPQASLDAAVSSISDIADDMTDADRLAVITFGDKVNVISDGSKSASSTVRKLKGLKADDKTTAFYTAMDSLIKVTENAGDKRTVAVVVSDGVDDTDAGMTEDELTDTLKQSGVAVYALQVGNVTASQTDHLKKFISVSGGEVYSFSEQNAKKTIKSLTGHLGEVYRVHLTGGTAPEKDTSLKLQIKGFDPVTWTVKKETWKKADKEETSAKKEAPEQKTEKKERIVQTNFSSEKRAVVTAIAVVVIVTAIVVVILLSLHNKKVKDAFYKENGLDAKEIEEINKKIKQKRRRH